MITDIRLRSQQLVNPAFDDPKGDLWHGWVHCRDRSIVWQEVGCGLAVEETGHPEGGGGFGEGRDIADSRVNRPTWHLVVAEDIRNGC